MALSLRNPRVRLHKYPFISKIYHNLTLHIIMSAVNSYYDWLFELTSFVQASLSSKLQEC